MPKTLASVPLLFSLLLSSLPVASMAYGQDPKDSATEVARRRFQEGVRHYDNRQYELARVAFAQAFALRPHPTVLLNLAQSEGKSGRHVDAARHFSQFLRENPDADVEQKEQARAGLTAAGQFAGRLRIRVSQRGADVLVDGQIVGRSPLDEPVFVEPGIRKIEAKLPGYTPIVVEKPAEGGTVTIVLLTLQGETTLVPAPQAAPTPVVSPKRTTPPTAPVSSEPVTERQPFFDWVASDPLAWVGGSVTLVGIATGTVFAVAAQRASNNTDASANRIRSVAATDPDLIAAGRSENPCYEPILVTATADYKKACAGYDNNRSTFETDVNLMWTGWAVAGAGVVGTLTLYWLRGTESKNASSALVPSVSPSFQGLQWVGSF